MSFQRFNATWPSPKPEYVSAVIDALDGQRLETPQAIALRTGLTRNQVNSALDHLNGLGRLAIVRQTDTPKVRVGLSKNVREATTDEDASRPDYHVPVGGKRREG
jgi:hypothetical protein